MLSELSRLSDDPAEAPVSLLTIHAERPRPAATVEHPTPTTQEVTP